MSEAPDAPESPGAEVAETAPPRGAALLRLIRWPGVLTAAANGATGFLLGRHATGQPEPAFVIAVMGGAGLLYAGGVVLNDVADARRDAEIHPKRPIPTGEVARSTGALFGLVLLAAGILIYLATGVEAAIAGAGAALAALIYDFWAKRWRVLGGVFMALARGGNALAGLLAGAGGAGLLLALEPAGTPPRIVIYYPLAVAAYTLVLTLVSTLEGRRRGPLLNGAAAISVALVAAAPYPWFTMEWAFAPACALLPLAGTLIVAARAAGEPQGIGIGNIVRTAVFGFLLVDSAWLFGRSWYDYGFGLLIAYVALRLVLARARS